jgi:CIC family chloride channel protein
MSPHPESSERAVDGRMLLLCALAILLALAAGLVADALAALISAVTNLAWYGRLSSEPIGPAGNHLGLWGLGVPVLGGLVVGILARFGSRAIRGHGIPEAMAQILENESRIPGRITWLKPLSSAIAIGTGGPFGAEGPIIATGGALGSLLGQVIPTTPVERRTLLAAGAAAGMAATFGCPVSAVLLAVELLLFEFRPRSLIPVALAAAAATGVRVALVGTEPAFAMPSLLEPQPTAVLGYVLVGVAAGLFSVLVTRLVYWIEDAFEKLPIHWMWWPALGGLAIGGVGLVAPHTLGVGYDNITGILNAGPGSTLTLGAIATLCAWKLVSWSIALGSGTSGGTLAPLFTLGGGLGAVVGAGVQHLMPHAGIDLRLAALVGMAATFAGASRAVLTSILFAFETTREVAGLLPLLGACMAAWLVSLAAMKHSIMTEKIARRGVRVVGEYGADLHEQVAVVQRAHAPVVCLGHDQTVASVLAWLQVGGAGSQHQGFPVQNGQGNVLGVVTRRDLFAAQDPAATVASLVRRPAVTVYEDQTLAQAVERMVRENVGRLPVVRRDAPGQVVGILTRSDVLGAHRVRLDEQERGTSRLRWVRVLVGRMG